MSFWSDLPRPFYVLAPMDDVTDVVFRQVVSSTATPDVMMTEFVSIDAMQSKGRIAAIERLRMEQNRTYPLVAQIWGNDPDKFYTSAVDLVEMGFSGIDINMGCPVRDVVARTCGGGLIGQNELVGEIIAATRAGAGNLPVSVKTRLGINRIITDEWVGYLLSQNLDAISVHARTVKEMSNVPAHWDEIAKIVALKNKLSPGTVIIANGDITNRQHGARLAADTQVDGLMIGRGVFHDIFTFEKAPREHTKAELLQVLLRHLDIYEESKSPKRFETLRKFFKIYVKGWPGASELRVELMACHTPAEVRVLANSALTDEHIKPDAALK